MESLKKAWVTGIDQIWLINLARRRDRLERFLQAQPEMNGRINFLPAYDGKNLKLTPSLARLFAPNNFDWHKPTMGCALSHLSLWQRLAVEPNPSASYLILEDDARLEPSWVRKVEEAFLSGSVPADYEVLYLGGILPQYRESFEQNVQPVNQLVARVHPDCRFGNNPPGYFHFCAYSYILSQRGARRLLDLLQFWNGYWLQADFVAAYHTPELSPPRKIYFLHPLIAESFQDTAQGLARPYDENQGQENQVDSDIWKNDDRFGPNEISAIKTNGLPLDIPAALGWAPDGSLSMSASALRQQAADSAPVASSDSTTKKVGLICVTRNNSSKLRTTLNSIIRHTKLESYDLYVIDNASSEEHTRIYGEILAGHIKVVRSDKNLHWVGGINLGLEMTRNYRYVAFLNDDIEVGPGWLENLVEILDCNEDVGAVGPMISNDRDWQGYDRVLKAFPAWKAPALEEIDRNDVLSMNEKIQGNDPLIRIGTGMLAFFCILLRRKVIDLVGSLDSDFTELYTCDDDDYCDRIQCAGYTLALSTNTYVAHYSGTSSTKIDAFSEKTKLSIELLDRKKAERRRSVQCLPENVKASGSSKKVGLVCVTRNSAEKLKVTLDSIVRNTDPELFDLYVVDNGSTDATVELCAGSWPPNIHFIRKNENLGWVGGINSCLPQAKKYPFVGFLNDDIEVGPRWLEHLVNLIEWNKTVGAVGPLTSNDRDWQGYERFRLGPVKPGLPELEGIDRQDVVQMSASMASFNPGVTLNDCVLAFFCVLIRTEIVEKIGLLDEAFNELYLGDDEDYCKRILATGHLLALSFNAYVAHHSEARSLAVEDYEVRYKKSQQIIAEKRNRGLYQPIRRLNLAALFPVKISLLHATRGRPEQADDARKLWLDRANKPERVEHIFALDHDDESSESLKKFHHVIQMQNGYSVGAWNLAAKHSTGDILMQMSDDWDPPAGWDDLVAGGLDISLERVLWVNEDYTRKDIMCMVILTRKYYEKHGLFDPRFKNVYSDDDFTARAKKLSAITYANNIVFKHKHFTTGDSAVDATYLRGNDHDEYHRAKILFDSIHNVAVMDESEILIKESQAYEVSAIKFDANYNGRNKSSEYEQAKAISEAKHIATLLPVSWKLP